MGTTKHDLTKKRAATRDRQAGLLSKCPKCGKTGARQEHRKGKHYSRDILQWMHSYRIFGIDGFATFMETGPEDYCEVPCYRTSDDRIMPIAT